jgi:hypothetical protein
MKFFTFFILIACFKLASAIDIEQFDRTSRSNLCKYWVVFDYKDGAYSVASDVLLERPDAEINQPQEMLCFNSELTITYPDFDRRYYSTDGKIIMCEAAMMAIRTPDYSPCTSKFTSTSIIGSAVKTIFTLGIGAGTTYKIDRDEIKKIFDQTNVAVLLSKSKNNDYFSHYHSDFKAAGTDPALLIKYINKYQDNDPEGLSKQAQKLLLSHLEYKKKIAQEQEILKIKEANYLLKNKGLRVCRKESLYYSSIPCPATVIGFTEDSSTDGTRIKISIDSVAYDNSFKNQSCEYLVDHNTPRLDGVAISRGLHIWNKAILWSRCEI